MKDVSQVDVYGLDHSPWVQAVLLGLHERDVAFRLTVVPPRSVLLRSGVLMPAARIDGGPWLSESATILQCVGYEAALPEDLQAIHAAWHGVKHRVRNSRQFFRAASLIRDTHPSPIRRMCRAFVKSFLVLYFYVLLQYANRIAWMPDPDDWAAPFLYWARKLERGGNEFLGGQAPNSLDLMLFGVIQCHCSIPVPPLPVLQEDPGLSRLRTWIASMHNRFSDYPHLYSGACFEPRRPGPVPASLPERLVFWLGVVVLLVAAPVSISLIVFLALRVPRSD